MTHHAFDEIAFDVPDGYTFLGIVRLRGEAEGFAPNLVITRDRLRQGETLQTYIDRQLVDLAKKLKRFVIRERREVRVGGIASHEISCTWHGTSGPVDQRITIVPRRISDAGGGVLTFTASAAKNKSEAAFATFRSVIESVTVDGASG
jgi:hypothetical protein